MKVDIRPKRAYPGQDGDVKRKTKAGPLCCFDPGSVDSAYFVLWGAATDGWYQADHWDPGVVGFDTASEEPTDPGTHAMASTL